MLSAKPKFKAVWELTSSNDVGWQRHISNMKLMPVPRPAATVLHAHVKAATLGLYHSTSRVTSWG